VINSGYSLTDSEVLVILIIIVNVMLIVISGLIIILIGYNSLSVIHTTSINIIIFVDYGWIIIFSSTHYSVIR